MSESVPRNHSHSFETSPSKELELQSIELMADSILDANGFKKPDSAHQVIIAKWQDDANQDVFLARAGMGVNKSYYMSVRDDSGPETITTYYRYDQKTATSQLCDERYQPLEYGSCSLGEVERLVRDQLRRGIPRKTISEETEAHNRRELLHATNVLGHRSVAPAIAYLLSIDNADDRADETDELVSKLVNGFGVDRYLAWKHIVNSVYDMRIE